MAALDQLDLVFVPGYGNSTGTHWQCDWFARMPHCHWVNQERWEAPVLSEWLVGLDACVAETSRPIVFVTHSLGGLLVSAWAERNTANVAGAFLVVPPDAEASAFPASITGFANPASRLAFASVLIATQDDRYSSFEVSKCLAGLLGSELFDAGAKQHINPASGFGPWPEGEDLLVSFCAALVPDSGGENSCR